ncbi:FMRFamide receptor [Aphelenchoides fujianensis]|nr:FMRFamide receptor [Aphelenchoides fujianensis]
MNEMIPNSTDIVLEQEEEDGANDKFISQLSMVFAGTMGVLCVLGVLMNSVSLYVFTRKSFRKRSINVLLCGLSLSDLCLCILALPVFNIPIKVTSRMLVYAYPIIIIAQTASVWSIVAVSIDRYLAVCHPFTARIWCTKKRAFLTVLFFEYTVSDDVNLPEEQRIVGLLRDNYLYMLVYINVLMLVTQFALPLLALSVLNCLVARTILKAGEMRRELVASERREFNTSKMLLYVVVLFIVCYLLSFLLNLHECFNPELFKQPIGLLINDVNNILVVANSSSSFIFYVAYSSRYRAQLRHLPVLGLVARRFCLMPPTAKYAEKSEKTNDYTTLAFNKQTVYTSYNSPPDKEESTQFVPEQQV